MKPIANFINKIGLTSLEIAIGGTFVWFGALLISGTTPLLPFFQAAFPGYANGPMMVWIGVFEIVLGFLILLPLFQTTLRGARITVSTTLALELLYTFALFFVLFFSSANVFSPFIPYVTAFGYFVLHKLLVVVTALVLTSTRYPRN